MADGNNAAMRETLEKIRFELNAYCDDCTLLSRMTEDPPDYTCLRDSLLEIERVVSAALAAPARNCDVGTAAEQYARFNGHCKARHKSDKPNPCGQANMASNPCAKCYSMWAQIPYEAKEKNNVPDKDIP